MALGTTREPEWLETDGNPSMVFAPKQLIWAPKTVFRGVYCCVTVKGKPPKMSENPFEFKGVLDHVDNMGTFEKSPEPVKTRENVSFRLGSFDRLSLWFRYMLSPYRMRLG